MDVRLVEESTGANEAAINPLDFAENVLTSCRSATRKDGPLAGVCTEGAPACVQHLCNAEDHLCTAHRLLDYAQLVAPASFTSDVNGTNQQQWSVRPQSPATNAGLAEQATLAAERANFAAINALAQYRGGCELPVSLQMAPDVVQTGSAYAATIFVESYDLGLHEARRVLSENATAVADQQFSDQAELADASRLAISGEVLSRSWVAHSLIGGAAGVPALPAVDREGFEPAARLSPPATRALQLLRIAAPPPARLASSADIDELVTGWGSTPNESLRGRWAVLMRADNLEAASPDAIYQRFGLSRAAFIEARQHLVRELAAFGRATQPTLPPDPLGGTQTTEGIVTLFAAVRMPPSPPLAEYYAAVSRHDPVVVGAPASVRPAWHLRSFVPDPAAPSTTQIARSLSHFADLATWQATVVLLRDYGVSARPLPVEARAVIANFAGDATRRRPHRVDACHVRTAVGDNLDVVLFGDWGQTAPQHLLVSGHAGLQCAVRGTVEGAACALAPSVLGTAETPTPDTNESGFSSRLHFLAPAPTQSVEPYYDPNATPVFIVRARGNGALPGQPGSYEPVVGWMAPIPEPGAAEGWRCETIPVLPELDEATSDAIQPSTTYAALSAQTCAGLPLDQRIPLENELTSDSGGQTRNGDVESSWRHYLEFARSAAAHADALGEDLIRTGQERDQRSEQAIDELETLCGVSLNIHSLSTETQDPSAAGASCTQDSDCTPSQRCADGTCVLDPLRLAAAAAATDTDRQRLQECLGDATTAPWATLGDRPLCFWWVPGDSSSICDGATRDRPCPFEGTLLPRAPGDPAVATCARPAGLATEIELIPVPETLNLFVTREDPPQRRTTDPSELPCAQLAQLRAGSGNNLALRQEVLASPFFRPEELRATAERLSWAPQPGDYSNVLLDDGPFLGTGNRIEGPSAGRWPYAPSPWNDLCPMPATATTNTQANGPFFCLDLNGDLMADPYFHAVRLRRAQANDMLARAVLAARIISGAGLEGVQFPYYARAGDRRLELREGEPRSQRRLLDEAPVFETNRGKLAIINDADAFGSVVEYDLSEMGRARAYWITGEPTGPGTGCSTIPQGAEWSLCPYDSTSCVEVFDDAVDCDDSSAGTDSVRAQRTQDRNVPMIVRAFTERADSASSVAGVAERMWTPANRLLSVPRLEDADALIDFALRSPTHNPIEIGPGSLSYLEMLTEYWRRSNCGVVNERSCGAASFSSMHPLAQASSTQCLSNVTPEVCYQSVGCYFRYADCSTEAGNADLDYPQTFDGNRAFIASRGLTRRDVLNGMELLCSAARRDLPADAINCENPGEIHTVGDMLDAAGYLDCAAARIETGAAQTIVRDVPARAAAILRRDGATGVHAATAGAYGEAVSELRAALVDLRNQGQSLAVHARYLAADIRELQASIERENVRAEISDWQLASTISSQITACAVAAAEAFAQPFKLITGSGAIQAGATCANTAIQIGVAARITDLEQEDTRLVIEQAFARFDREFTTHSRGMAETQSEIRASSERIDAALARIRSLQEQGRRSLARALFLDSDSTGRQFAGDTVLRRRYNTLAERYREAHRTAVRAAYLAKIAVEQRLGIPLSELRDPMPLLDEAPASWHMDVCSLSGIDYDRVRNSRVGPTGERMGDDSEFPVPENYSGEFIGDYVRRLELVLESYSLAYPFQDGTDTSVLSLRDELWGIRAPCEVEVPNLLFQSAHLDVMETPDMAGWVAEGCTEYPPDPMTGDPSWPPLPPPPEATAPPAPHCVSATRIDEDYMGSPALGPIPLSQRRYGRSPGFRVEVGAVTDPVYSNGAPILNEFGQPARTVTPTTRLVQWIRLPQGRFRVSWYGRQPTGGDDPRNVVRLVRLPSPGVEVAIAPTGPIVRSSDARENWYRYWFFVDVPAESPVGVVISPEVSTRTHALVDLAGLMVEDASATMTRDPSATETRPNPDPEGMPITVFVAELFPPGPFFETDTTRTRALDVCEDTTGAAFRRRAWHRGCARLCPDGYGGDCDPAIAEQHCYYETSFTLDPETLERAGLLGGAGFAFGNFNYRVERFGLNLVGTGIRDCSRVVGPTPSTCYASGNVAYSIVHHGPYWVRNHTGGLYGAPLFTGRIERARSLAAERYLTNPLSSADRGLIEPYVRTELRGRPMPGTYSLRVWDDPGLVWENVEDVQLVLDYRYWTRQQ